MKGWIANRRADDGGFILWQDGIAKSILAITLLEDALVRDGLGREESEGIVLEYRSIALRSLVDAILEVAEDDDA